MNELKLTDQEAQKLIDLIKHLIKNYSNHLNTLTNEDRGTIKIKSKDNKYTFSLDYIFALNNNHLNFRDNRTNYTLVRINLDDKFHKNSDGIVKGNRIEIFSETEYIAKNDGYTHYKAYPLPFGNVKNTDDFFEALLALFEYTHVDSSNLELNRQTTLFNN